MRVLGVVPARGGSKAIPGKNVTDLGGVPLLAWTARAALAAPLARVVLSTDDTAIADVGRDEGLDVPFVRPAALATDDASSLDVALHALEAIEAMEAQAALDAGTVVEPYDAIMLLQPTTPFRSKADISAAIAQLDVTGADSVIGVVDVGGHHPARMKFLDDDRLVDPPFVEDVENQPRQELPRMVIRNGAVYLTRTHVLRGRTFKGEDARALVMPAERSVNIDVPMDLLLARTLVAEGLMPVPPRAVPQRAAGRPQDAS